MPAFSIADRNTLASSAVNAARSVATKLAWTRPASIREKSRSVFTSLSSLSPFRCHPTRSAPSGVTAEGPPLERSSSSGPSIRVSGVLNSWLHVAEEDGLRSIELGEPLRPVPLVLERPGIRDGGGNVPRHEIEEPAVVLVELPPGAIPATRNPVGRSCPGLEDGEDHGASRRLGRQGPPGRSPIRSRRSSTRTPRRARAAAASGDDAGSASPGSREIERGLAAAPGETPRHVPASLARSAASVR